jgi:hypothetical protein
LQRAEKKPKNGGRGNGGGAPFYEPHEMHASLFSSEHTIAAS